MVGFQLGLGFLTSLNSVDAFSSSVERPLDGLLDLIDQEGGLGGGGSA